MILRIFLCMILAGTAVQVMGQSASLELSVTHQFGGKPLQRGMPYLAPAGDTFTISRFRYFISNFSLLDMNGKETALPPAYFLVDDAKEESKIMTLKDVPPGSYKSIRFLIGVDSIKNVSGPQSGALAVESGMFWSWNSGYIMAQLEGYSPVIKSPTREFVFHVGGYRQKDQVLKFVTLSFPAPVQITGSQNKRISMTADVNKWFLPDTVGFLQQPVVMAPGPQARKLAANYRHMFTITSVGE
jgi:hypothetical protein